MENKYVNKSLEERKKEVDEKFEPLFKILRLIPEIRETLAATRDLIDNRHKIVVKDTKLYNELHGR